jgi:hypothetical protein
MIVSFLALSESDAGIFWPLLPASVRRMTTLASHPIHFNSGSGNCVEDDEAADLRIGVAGMGSKKRRNVGKGASDRALEGIMLRGEDLEVLTDDLVEELVKAGSHDEKTLRGYQAMGWKYCRSRDSFFSPPEAF